MRRMRMTAKDHQDTISRSIMKTVLLALLLLIGCSYAEDGDAKIILIKSILNDVITEGRDLAVEYLLFNAGDGVASSIVLADSSFSESNFELVKGMTSVKWDRIYPGGNVTHAIVVRPTRAGAYNFSSSVVQYVNSEGSEPTFGYSNELGELEILSLKEYNRVHASHMLEWSLFAVWCIPSLLFPYMLYRSSKSRYTVKQKKAN